LYTKIIAFILKAFIDTFKKNIKGRIHTDNFLIPLKTSNHSIHVQHNQNHENNNNHILDSHSKPCLCSVDTTDFPSNSKLSLHFSQINI